MNSIKFNGWIEPLKRFYLFLALFFMLAIVWEFSPDIKAISEPLRVFSVDMIILCLSLAILSYGFRTLRWLGYMRLTEYVVSNKRHILIYLSGFSFTVSPGKAGELMRGVYLKDLGVQFRYVLISFVSERLLDIIVVVFLGTYVLVNHFGIAFGVLSTLIFLLPLCVAPAIKFSPHSFQDKAWFAQIRILASLWQIRVVLKSLSFTLLTWSVQGIILYCVLIELGIEVEVAMAVSVYCLSLLIGAASFIPSGIGVTEIGMTWLLTQIGVDNNIAIVASITTRMMTLWPAMVIGLFCAFVLKRSKVETKSASLKQDRSH